MNLRTKIEEAIPYHDGYNSPEWLECGAFCNDDDGFFCECRQRYAVDEICTIIREELEKIKIESEKDTITLVLYNRIIDSLIESLGGEE